MKRARIFVAGLLIGLMVAGATMVLADARMLEAVYNNIQLVVDGTRVTPRDANGAPVDPFIVNGTVYLPVRAVAQALGKEVYWDGPTYTVYVGALNGALSHPSLKLEDAVNIGGRWLDCLNQELVDNQGNTYAAALRRDGPNNGTFETNLEMRYALFRGVAYAAKGAARDDTASFLIEADGHTLYTSPELTKTSEPLKLEIDIRGYNNFKIKTRGNSELLFFGDCGFYQ